MHYVIGDVHGCFIDMMALINLIESCDKDAQILFVGDFVDRGSKVWEVLEWAMHNITPNGKYQSVRGNHEEMLIDWFYDCKAYWKKGRRGLPKSSLDFSKWAENMHCNTEEKLAPIIDFFMHLPVRKDIWISGKGKEPVHFAVAHADITRNIEIALSKKQFSIINHCFVEIEDDPDFCMWNRKYNEDLCGTEIVVHGHTPTCSPYYYLESAARPGMISYRRNEINVDGGCVFYKLFPQFPSMLAAICLETLQEFYPYSIEQRFEQMYQEGVINIKWQEAADRYKKLYMSRENAFRTQILDRYK